MTTAHDTIRPKALVFDMQGTVFNFYDPMMHELARLSAVAPRLQDWSTFAGRWSAAAHDAIVEIAAGRKPWQPNSAVYAEVLPALLRPTAVDTPGAHRRVVDNGTAGLGTDVGAAKLTTTSHARRSAAFAISGDTIAGGSPGC